MCMKVEKWLWMEVGVIGYTYTSPYLYYGVGLCSVGLYLQHSWVDIEDILHP